MEHVNMNKLLNLKRDIRFESKGENEYKLTVYGSIGGWFSENNAEAVRRKIQDVKAEKIHVHINSGGGSAFDGVAICNQLKQHSAEIIVHIDGWAASAASVIAMAGDKIIMPSNTMMMIHQASTFEYGNADLFEKTARDLRKIDSALAASYKKRFVGTDEELKQLLKDETWLTAEEAVALGLADEIADEIEIDDTQEDEEVEVVENFKEDLVAKYMKQPNNQNPKEPIQEPVNTKQNLSTLFLTLGGK
ncbi:head maturation protease, ClpP-related [Bacillus tropicus]|uniref:ATP-dependent Clp protease proteolytic subunit n=2 Tax=Bacillus cereus group TaxID=86661 RepID=A0A5C5A8X9_9BACI|nr:MULTISPECIES: head maturation protease, ClpP-related [Bacillus]ALL23644.1 peptidase S14 [Bacillus thuringiensis]EEM21336.1 Peptidase S14 ClpP [Bacillus thuringiensis serovar tochigiensis BGSC 4Y1]ACO25973.1 peptidase S14 ClpP [Bacillus cereus 03BB102]AJG55330.1 clp protease family protein [Bacillus cereus 03BB102]MCP1164805.1 Clp protease ClpP [Bacillus sp. 1813sda1]